MKQYVLTGGPRAGKTSILLSLEWRGENVIQETAIDYIFLQQARGVEEPWLKSDFQDQILEMKLIRERRMLSMTGKRVFLDRGLIDGWAYYRKDGKAPSPNMKETIEEIRKNQRFTKVFLIENLIECKATKSRRENIEEAVLLENLQEENYQSVGFEVIRIPSAPLEERVERILYHANKE